MPFLRTIDLGDYAFSVALVGVENSTVELYFLVYNLG